MALALFDEDGVLRGEDAVRFDLPRTLRPGDVVKVPVSPDRSLADGEAGPLRLTAALVQEGYGWLKDATGLELAQDELTVEVAREE